MTEQLWWREILVCWRWLKDPTIAAQADPIHRVVRVCDRKHLDGGQSKTLGDTGEEEGEEDKVKEENKDEDEDAAVEEEENIDKADAYHTWHPGRELTDEKTVVSIRQSGDISTECE